MSSQALGQPIPGSTNLYPWGQGKLLKLYDADTPTDFITYLRRIESALHQAGLPVAGVGEIVELDGCLGQVYERIEGGTMADALLGTAEDDWARIDDLACIFAGVQAQVHASAPISAMPAQRHVLSGAVDRLTNLPADLKAAVLQCLDVMPDGDRICHGDFHPFNVLLSPGGPIVIDWNNSHIGLPMEDVARSRLILSGVHRSDGLSQTLFDRFNAAYIEHYFQVASGSEQELAGWRPIVAAVRLCDGIPTLTDWLLDEIRAGLDALD